MICLITDNLLGIWGLECFLSNKIGRKYLVKFLLPEMNCSVVNFFFGGGGGEEG